MKTFRNPVSDMDAPDPFMTFDPVTGYYYALFTHYNTTEIYRSKKAGNILTDNDVKIVYRANETDGTINSFWAPEMHKGTDGKWYIYTSASFSTETHIKNLFILQSATEDPFGEWVFKGRPLGDIYAIDPTVYTAKDGKQYVCYSRVYPEYGQVLEIRDMINPYTFGEKYSIIAKAEYDWELVPPYTIKWAINEGAFFVERGERLYIVYSANGCWSKDYCLGVLEFLGGDMCNNNNWKKHSEPFFTHGDEPYTYGPGHASFFYSPDKSEIWCAYHVLPDENPSNTNAPRYFCIQPISFDDKDYFIKSHPVGRDFDILPPSGEKE